MGLRMKKMSSEIKLYARDPDKVNPERKGPAQIYLTLKIVTENTIIS